MKHLLRNYLFLLILTTFLTGCPEKDSEQDQQPIADPNACIFKGLSGPGFNISVIYKTNGQIETIRHGNNLTIIPIYDSNNNIIKTETREDGKITSSDSYTLNGKNVTRLENMRIEEEVAPDGTRTSSPFITRDDFSYSGTNVSPDKSINYISNNGTYEEIGYTNYTYDAKGNLIKKEEFRKFQSQTTPQLFSRHTYTYDDKLFPKDMAIALGYEFPIINNKNNRKTEKFERLDTNNNNPNTFITEYQDSFSYNYNEKGYPTTIQLDNGNYNVSYDCK